MPANAKEAPMIVFLDVRRAIYVVPNKSFQACVKGLSCAEGSLSCQIARETRRQR